jgi:hypothetical protein
MAVDPKQANRALNGWARSQGYSDFDFYIATGGSIGDAARDLQQRRTRIDLATAALYEWKAPPPPPPPPELHPELPGRPELDDYERANARMAIGPEALAQAEAEVVGDEPVDPDNAQIAGAEYGDA